MHPGVQAVFVRSGGLITREEALDLDLSPERIRASLRTGEWVVVRRGVYADGAIWAELDEHRGRPRLQARAAVRKMRRAWVMSHDSSAHELELDILTPVEPLVHVTRPGFTNAWTEHGVKHHLAHFRPEQVVEINGVRVLNLARTAVDIARERGEMHGVPACDSAMRMGVPREALIEASRPMVSWPYVTQVRSSIDLADPGAQTVGESLCRLLVHELDIGRPETQFPVSISGGVAWCDIRVGNHMFEFDGRIKYLRVQQGGVADRRVEDVLWDEKKRQRLVCAEGLGMSRIIWEDFWGARRVAAKARLRAEYDVTVARFGTQLPEHLARFAREARGRRNA